MKNIVIIGAGGHAKVIADIILKRKELLDEKLNIVGFLDDGYKNLKYNKIFDIPILGDTNLIEKLEQEKKYNYVIGIGNNKIREKISNKFPNLNYYIAIHPKSVIGTDVVIEEGTVVMANVVINSGTKIGKHCILNTGSIIEHDNRIEDYCHISVGARLAGTVSIGKFTWVGIGATVKNNIYLDKKVIVGAGGVVVDNIEKEGIYVGVPTKELKKIGGGVDNKLTFNLISISFNYFIKESEVA